MFYFTFAFGRKWKVYTCRSGTCNMGTILPLICKYSFWSINVANVIYQFAKRAWKIVPEAIYVLSIPLIVKLLRTLGEIKSCWSLNMEWPSSTPSLWPRSETRWFLYTASVSIRQIEHRPHQEIARIGINTWWR